MQVLFAPWRMAYILAGERPDGECIFCAFPADAPRWREHLVLWANDRCSVMMNKFPYNNGHLLVMPRRHVADPADLPEDEQHALSDAVRTATVIVRRILQPEGFNIGMNLGRAAGAGIDSHCHWHIVPRWNGDTNFMPILAETKVIGEHLLASYDRLRPAFEGAAP